MPGLARLPDWLYPITGWTIGIIGLVIVFIAQIVDTLATHWREDRRDEQQDRGE